MAAEARQRHVASEDRAQSLGKSVFFVGSEDSAGQAGLLLSQPPLFSEWRGVRFRPAAKGSDIQLCPKALGDLRISHHPGPRLPSYQWTQFWHHPTLKAQEHHVSQVKSRLNGNHRIINKMSWLWPGVEEVSG